MGESHRDSHWPGDMGDTVAETVTGQETWVRQSQARDMGESVTGQEIRVRQSQRQPLARRLG